MVKIDYLEPLMVYKVRPPIIMTEDRSNRKKFSEYIILAPSIEAELNYLATANNIQFRSLTKYFITKKWQHLFHGAGKRIIKPDEDNTITNLINKYNQNNLKDITGVTSYLETNKTRPLKDLNVLIEINHITNGILSNEKDNRMLSLKIKELLKEYTLFYSNIKPGPNNYLGKYKTLTTIIPLELWFDKKEYQNPTLTMKYTSKNPMGQIFGNITPELLKKLGTIILVDNNLLIKIDYNAIPDDAKPDFIQSEIRRFMLKAYNIKSGKTNISTEDKSETIKIAESLKQAEYKTKVDVTADTIINKVAPNIDDINQDKKDEIINTIKEIEDNTADDITTTSIKLSTNDTNKIIADAKLAGKSIESFKRDQILKEKYKELSIGTNKISDILNTTENITIPEIKIPINTVNDNMKKIKSEKFEKIYNDKLAEDDLLNILLHFSSVNPPLYINKNIEVIDASTATDRIIKYKVEFEDTNRKRHRFSFLLPKMYQEKYLYLNDQKLNITHQKLPYPITKVSPDKCQLVTNYNKIFTYRYGTNLSPRITKLKKIILSPNCPKYIKATPGNSTILNKVYLTTIEYDELASSIVRLQIGKSINDILTIYFTVDDTRAIINPSIVPTKVKWNTISTDGVKTTKIIEDLNLIPIGLRKNKNNKSYYFISGTSNHIYDETGNNYGELSDFIVNELYKIDDKMKDEFSKTTTGSRFIYSKSTIMAEDIPTILILAAADPNGLIGVLEKAKITYSFSEKRSKIDNTTIGSIPFEDGYLTYERYPYENSLLLNGLSIVPTKEYKYLDFMVRDTYIDIFDTLYSRRNLIDGIENFYYMMIDPITKDVLEKLNMPTDFTTLMLYCNGILADNTFQIDSDYNNTRIRSNEIIYVYLYKFLADAWAPFKDGRTSTFSIPEDCVIKKLLTANIIDPHSKLNVTLEAENDRQIKLKGPSGMNEDHSFTIEKRAYHPTMRGLVGVNSVPSGEVGINRHLTLNSNINDARGFITINKSDYDGTELESPGELLQTFGLESADMERVAMSLSQSKHLVPVANQSSSIISYDMERVIPYLSNDFAFKAKQDGKIIEIKDNLMIVQYKDGSYDDIDLSEHPDKNTDGGFFIMNKMDTKFNVGDNFAQDELLAYDKKYFNDNDMFGDPCANIGTMARVMLVSDGNVYEDAGYMTDTLAHKLATKITLQKRVILSKFANIKYMVKIGDHVKTNDPILTFDDTEDEFSSQLLSAMADEAEDSDEVIAGTAPVISKVTGVIKDIYIYYTIPLDEMTPSMKTIVEKYIKSNTSREKTLNKYCKPHDSNTIVKNTSQATVDSQGKYKGVEVGDGIFIDFYIEYEDITAVGDKITNYTALKCTESFIIPENLAPYTDFNPERKIDAALSFFGTYKRMVFDIIKVGSLSKLCIEYKRILRDKYLSLIENELKK